MAVTDAGVREVYWFMEQKFPGKAKSGETFFWRLNPGSFADNERDTPENQCCGKLPDGNSALMLVAARLRYIAASKWGMKQYLKMERLKEMQKEQSVA